MKNPLAYVCRTCAAAALALFLTATSAGASVVFRGAIDPIFGLGITGLSYSGEAFFNVADDCLNASQDGTHDPNADTCGGIVLLSESITLTNSVTSATQTLTFWPDPTFTPTDPITSYDIFNGTLGGVDTVPVGPQFVTVAGLGYTGPLWLELFTTFTGDSQTPNPQADLITGTCTFDGDFRFCNMDPDTPTTGHSNPATVTITRVPEPGTLALLIVAVGAGWLVRRRHSTRR